MARKGGAESVDFGRLVTVATEAVAMLAMRTPYSIAVDERAQKRAICSLRPARSNEWSRASIYAELCACMSSDMC